MKKAYVKPVFMAEEFVVTATVAGCNVKAGNPLPVYDGQIICQHLNNGHAIGKGSGDVNNLWDYAYGRETSKSENTSDSYIFTSGNQTCDFLWNSAGGSVGIWTTDNSSEQKAIANAVWKEQDRQNTGVLEFFFGNFMDFFRGVGSDGCTPMYDIDGDGVIDGDEQLFS